MPPRKKRPVKPSAIPAARKTRSGAVYQPPVITPKANVNKKTPDDKKEKPQAPAPRVIEPMVTRSHKKFGKFRYLADESADVPKQAEDVSKPDGNSGGVEVSSHSDNTSSNDSNDVVEMEGNENEVQMNTIIETGEKAPALGEMECTRNMSAECEIVEHLSNLNVAVDDNQVEGNKQDVEAAEYHVEEVTKEQEIFMQSEIVFECISEEVIPIGEEQEVELSNDGCDVPMVADVIEETKENTVDYIESMLEKAFADTIQENSANTGNAKENETPTEEPSLPQPVSQDEQTATEQKPPIEETILSPSESSTPEQPQEEPAITVETPKKEPQTQNKSKQRPLSKSKSKSEKKSSQKAQKSAAIAPLESSVRRSSRIKSISVLKQKSKGHGLVKHKREKEASPKRAEIDTSDNSNSGQGDAEKIAASSDSVFATPAADSDLKPVKVKSRWRKSSELEMVNSSISASPQMNPETQNVIDAINNNKVDEVEKRLKQFVHLKENQYLTDRVSCKEAKKMTCDCFLTQEEIDAGEYGCGEDCLNRLLMIECGNLCAVSDRCTNKRFQKGQIAPCEAFQTDKKGLGIRASANIPYGEFILEYVGEVLDPEEFEKRATEYSKDKNQHYYFMSLRADAVIDATQKGNISRFINHSCDPNAETQKWTVNGELRIGFFSKRTILAGEEITFDYQFQRYGKEAQKCYCEAAICRGWLGEEPDDDEDDEDEEDEEEEEEEGEEIKEESAAKNEKLEVTQPAADVVLLLNEEDEAKVKVEKIVKKEKKKIIRVRKPRKDLFEDIDPLEDEIESLQATGLKNQAHTLKLSRLIVRAKEPPQRAKLLRILRHGELPCRRLFLDYHGLRLIHGWMTDAQQMAKADEKLKSLKLEILQTLATLPIPNKTMLQDSKVLPTVEKWSVGDDCIENSPIDSDSNSPKQQETNEPAKDPEDANFHEDMDISPAASDEKPFVADAKKIPETNPQLPDYDTEIIALAIKLLEEWSVLKEVFRIPKKERIEQMKEHEREADRKYKANLSTQHDRIGEIPYKYSWRHRRKELLRRRSNDRQSNLDKFERRRIFAMQIEIEESERRRKQQEMWRQHEQRCIVMGTDPRFTAPYDPNQGYQCIWNPQTGQWQNYPLPPQFSQNQKMHLPPQAPPNQNFPPHQFQNPQQFLPPHHKNILPPQMQNKNPQSNPVVHHLQQQYVSNIPVPPNVTVLPNMSMPHNHNIPPTSTGLPPNIAMNINFNPQMVHNPHMHQMGPNNYPGLPPMSMPGVKPPPPLPALPYQDNIKEKEEVLEVKFMGPIPPPAKLPPKWKCAKDKYGRPYYYHIKIRKSQWEPPEFPPEETNDDYSDSTSSSETSSLSSDTSSEETDSDDDIDDERLMMEVKNKFKVMDAAAAAAKKQNAASTEGKETNKEAADDNPDPRINKEKSLDDRLIEEFCLLRKDESPQTKKRRIGLVQEIPISPRTEEDRLQFKEDVKRYKQNKEKLKRQRELILEQSRKHLAAKASSKPPASKSTKTTKKHKITVKTRLKEIAETNSETAKKIKESFRSSMAGVMVSILNAYRKPECKEGRITNTEDFKHLARKLTHFVMLKELKHCQKMEDLTCTDSVKSKAKEFVRKYMSKFGENYQRPSDEPDY